jgi:hypothetical protein
MKRIRVDDYFYAWDKSDGKYLRITKMNGDDPICDLALIVSSDLSISPYYFSGKGEKNTESNFDIDNKCIIFTELLPLTEEKVKTLCDSDDLKTIYNPKILNDFHSQDYVVINNLNNEKILSSFYFTSSLCTDREIGIKNFLYDGKVIINLVL